MYKTLFIYLTIINLIGFILMLIDKSRAIHKEWRIPEKTLLMISVFGGSIGMFAGMHVFKHKTKHLKFTIGVPLIFIIQIIAAVYLFK
ncbi:DUF1294 domain-containing protein [uncultured Clostridium sp.]|uniref:DUF1294 domain-containing protein n=1 Tax=uncultured Clostridium sp. TaxID=59620 RepID=UPI0025DE95EA|nr:DUF1294 domain-containing protein [uncultured Clostridium sp.]